MNLVGDIRYTLFTICFVAKRTDKSFKSLEVMRRIQKAELRRRAFWVERVGVT